jgi:hypothetical protein
MKEMPTQRRKGGEVRPDGMIFRAYRKANGRVYEMWETSPARAKRLARQVRLSAEALVRNKQNPEWVINRRKQMREKMRVVRKTKPEQQMVIRAKVRARQKGLDFNISEADVVIPKRCPVLGIPLRLGEGAPTDNSPELDRINNKKGYTKGNIMVISRKANRIKNDCTPKELMRIAQFYASLA